jgi:hypothetical protein
MEVAPKGGVPRAGEQLEPLKRANGDQYRDEQERQVRPMRRSENNWSRENNW